MAKKRGRSRTVHKASIPTAQQGARDISAQITAATAPASTYTAQPLPTDPGWSVVPFAPGQRLPSAPINVPRSDTGQQDPRLYELEPGYNLYLTPRRLLPWKMLREAADRISLFRRCIEIRKNHLQGLDWSFRVSQDAVNAMMEASPGSSRARLERDLRDSMSTDLARAKTFWQLPDRGEGYEFEDWLGLLLEEVYVTDALSIYPHMNLTGQQLWSFEILDGTTIKPLRNERGGRPMPPLPAYQQILFGYPRGEYTASAAGDGVYPMSATDLVYKRRVVRNWTPYGYSAVEQALDDGDLWLKRHRWLKAEYTAGAMPTSIFEVSPEAGLSPQQVADLERFFNDLLSGNTLARHEARFLPPGIVPSKTDDVGERYKPDFDMYLLKMVAAHFDTQLTELGFTETGGLGSTGYHEGQENVQERKTLPLSKWVARLITNLTRRYLKVDPAIEFFFLGLDEEDQAAADELEASRQADGVITLNERRDRLGYDRYPFAEADMPMVKLARGILFLEGASQGAPAGVAIEPEKATEEVPAAGNDDADDGDTDQTAGDQPAKTGDDTAAKAAEAAAYRRWARKGARGRTFEWRHHTDAEIAQLTKAGGAGPKARTGQWPGWAKDQAAAKYWAAQLSAAMTGAIRIRDLAEAWLGSRRKAADPADAGSWLYGQDLGLADAMAGPFTGIYTDGYYIGAQSAAAVTASDAEVDWGDWTPGDTEAANEALGIDGGAGLDQLLSSAGVTIRSIEANRLDELSQALADALDNGDSVDKLASTLRGVLADPTWAYLVAQTEMTRAVAASTQATYRRNGIEANYWLTAADQRVCPVCEGNAADGAVRVGAEFSSGVTAPPGHPACRCALAPDVVPLDELL